ncbi:interleukin 17a/f3 precursor [Danio rerio]|uniref:Interleukin 17_5 n=1 Tax=Danio rerio TaxID=7955 RepID=Q5TKT0_DANRE|nr:interleukin 17a/f3 precursor [Danio rerio]AAI15082.1 Interleukin 17a/f3 [Danio rerio]BAD72790.1 Interleukin 17_5 [Danio rerio]|eukprot:NP_001018626.1 interleukin 17a/f3 precursor [Danio rerio]
MRLSRVFRAVLLLFLLMLLLDAALSENRTKRKRCSGVKKCTSAGCKSRCQRKTAWVILNSAWDNIMSDTPSPDRSLSPWTYTTSVDESRIPSTISEAKCEKRGCLTKDGEEDLGLESQPIYYQINILRRVKKKNSTFYALKLETKKVSVGCTCVLPIVLPQN